MADEQVTQSEEEPVEKAEEKSGDTTEEAVKTEKTEEKAEEASKENANTEKTEKKTEEAPKESVTSEKTPAKKKKINKLSLEEINKKIDDLNSSGQIHSRFYKDLIQRKNELIPSE